MQNAVVPKSHIPADWLLYLIGTLILVVGLALRFYQPDWVWGVIGSVVGLVSVVFMLLRDRLVSYADSYQNSPVPKEAVNTKGRRAARFATAVMYPIGIPLVLLAAIYQIWANPTLQIKAPPDDVVLDVIGGKGPWIDGKKLNEALKTSHANIKEVDDAVGALWYPDLLVVNCGKEKECNCPATYLAVRAEPPEKWDLNEGTMGAKIRLCYAKKPYRAPSV